MEWKHVAIAASASAAGYLLYSTLKSDSWLRKFVAPKNWVEVGVVEELFIHPIKSCRGISVPEAECTEYGLKYRDMTDRYVQFVI